MCSAHASVPDVYAYCIRIGSLRVCSAWRERAFSHLELSIRVRKKLMRMLRVRISSWRVRSVYASVPDAYAQCTRHFLTRVLSMFWRDLSNFNCALSAPISSWPLCSVHSPFPDAYAQCTHQFLTRMLSALISTCHVCSVHSPVPDAYAQCTHQFLMHMHWIPL